MSEAALRHEEQCPTCGRFVSLDDGYYDVEPGGKRGTDWIVPYCNPDCADRKSPPADPEGEQ